MKVKRYLHWRIFRKHIRARNFTKAVVHVNENSIVISSLLVALRGKDFFELGTPIAEEYAKIHYSEVEAIGTAGKLHIFVSLKSR